jgi:hypothetical protein
MTHPELSRSHPSERDLVRYMDHELSDVERGRMRRHLDGCVACQERLSQLMSFSAEVSEALAEAGAGVEVDALARARAREAVRRANRTAPRRSPWAVPGRAAAAIALIMVGALAADPVLAWVHDHWWPGKHAERVVHTLPAATVAPEARHGPTVLFEPTSGTFEISIANPQAVGSIRIQVRDVARASAEVSNPVDEAILVLPSGLRIENLASSRASYTLTLPSSLRKVEVMIGDRTASTLILDSLPTPITRDIPLTDDPVK